MRAVWARDREISITDWESNLTPKHEDEPFRMSLDPADRNMLVRQSSEIWPGADGRPIAPVPVAATRLWLSALGAWLDLHGAWTTKPYSLAAMTSILAWDEIAPMGRDQYVRVVYPGYLYPLGHQAALVKVTERKLKDVSPSVAGLYQRKFLVIGEPVRTYADTHDFPFIRVGIRPLVTPPLDDPGNDQNSHFWPSIDGSPFGFILDALDQESRPVRLVAPLLWVAEQYGAQGAAQRKDVRDTYDQSPNRKVPALGQKVAFGPVRKGGDTVLDAQAISLTGDPAKTDSRPRMSQADVLLPAVQQLSGVGPVPISYNDRYKAGGFTAANNTGELWATVVTDASLKELPTDDVIALPQLGFGSSAAAGSDKAGGFISPDLPIRGLSRKTGTVGDLTGMATGTFDPAAFLEGALPKLFGIVSLADLVKDVAPSVVSEALDRIEAVLADLQRAKAAAQNAIDEAKKLQDRAAAKTTALQNDAQAALAEATAVAPKVTKAVDDFVALLGTLADKEEAAVDAAVAAPLNALRSALGELHQLGPKLPPFIRNEVATLTKVLDEVLAAADLVQDLYRFLNGFNPSSVQARFRFEWRPTVDPWPAGGRHHPRGQARQPRARGRRPRQRQGPDGRRGPRGDPGLRAQPGRRRAARPDRVRPPLVQGGLVGQGRGRRRHPEERVRRAPRLRRDDQGADPVRRVLRPAVPRRQPAGADRGLHARAAEPLDRRLHAREHVARRRRAGAVPRQDDLGRLQLLHARAAVHARRRLPRRRRLVRDPDRPRQAAGARARARGRRVPVRRPRRRVRLDLGDDRDLHPAGGRRRVRSPATSGCAARSTCSA